MKGHVTHHAATLFRMFGTKLRILRMVLKPLFCCFYEIAYKVIRPYIMQNYDFISLLFYYLVWSPVQRAFIPNASDPELTGNYW